MSAMAWEWVSPVSAAGGAILGSLTTYLAAGRLARKNAEHTERIARDDRAQQRIAEAYVELLDITTKLTQWATHKPSALRTPTDEPRSAVPEHDSQIRARVLVKAYGSVQIQRLHEDFLKLVFEVEEVERLIRVAREARREGVTTGAGPAVLMERLYNEVQPAVIAAEEALEKAVNSELRGAPDRPLG